MGISRRYVNRESGPARGTRHRLDPLVSPAAYGERTHDQLTSPHGRRDFPSSHCLALTATDASASAGVAHGLLDWCHR